MCLWSITYLTYLFFESDFVRWYDKFEDDQSHKCKGGKYNDKEKIGQKRHTIICKTLHSNINIAQHKPNLTPGLRSGIASISFCKCGTRRVKR